MEHDPDLMPELVKLIRWSKCAERLLLLHVEAGGRCKACTVGGGHGHLPWPCTTRLAAEEADRLDREQRRRREQALQRAAVIAQRRP